eukprot:g6288.t1
MRSAMVARCQQLDLWPPNPPPEGIDNADCDCSKDTSSIVAMAQRLYNQAQKRDASYTRLLSTASFLADFAYEAGLPTPQFFLTRDPVTEKFETMADEYLSDTGHPLVLLGVKCTPLSVLCILMRHLFFSL